VPPIFQTEVAADAIYFATRHRRRSLWVGGPTTRAIVADKFAPGLLDHYLAENGYSSQQTDEPEEADRPDNLWQPVDAEGRGDYGARGRFDERARSFSVGLALTKARPWILAMVAQAVGMGVGLAVGRYAGDLMRPAWPARMAHPA
jgi:hypothetical protein